MDLPIHAGLQLSFGGGEPIHATLELGLGQGGSPKVKDIWQAGRVITEELTTDQLKDVADQVYKRWSDQQ